MLPRGSNFVRESLVNTVTPLDSAADETPPPHAMSMVLVDDSQDLRFFLRVAIERGQDFRIVAEAANGEEGLAAAVEHQPDVVLLDIAMPVMDGLEALPLIRKACPGTVVVMLSAFGPRYGLQHQAALLGAHGYILKDGRMDRVLAELKTIIEGVGDLPSPRSRPGPARTGSSEEP